MSETQIQQKALQDIATFVAFFGMERAATYFSYDKQYILNAISQIELFQLKFMKFYKKLIWAMSTKEQTPTWEISDKLKIPLFVVTQILKQVNDSNEKEDFEKEKRMREEQNEEQESQEGYKKQKTDQNESNLMKNINLQKERILISQNQLLENSKQTMQSESDRKGKKNKQSSSLNKKQTSKEKYATDSDYSDSPTSKNQKQKRHNNQEEFQVPHPIKTFQCQSCKVSWENFQNYKSHMIRYHEDIKIEAEEFNNSEATRDRYSLVQENVRQKYLRKYSICQYCNQSFKQRHLLDDHIKQSHADKLKKNQQDSQYAFKFKCKLCDERFCHQIKRYFHMKKNHPELCKKKYEKKSLKQKEMNLELQNEIAQQKSDKNFDKWTYKKIEQKIHKKMQNYMEQQNEKQNIKNNENEQEKEIERRKEKKLEKLDKKIIQKFDIKNDIKNDRKIEKHLLKENEKIKEKNHQKLQDQESEKRYQKKLERESEKKTIKMVQKSQDQYIKDSKFKYKSLSEEPKKVTETLQNQVQTPRKRGRPRKIQPPLENISHQAVKKIQENDKHSLGNSPKKNVLIEKHMQSKGLSNDQFQKPVQIKQAFQSGYQNQPSKEGQKNSQEEIKVQKQTNLSETSSENHEESIDQQKNIQRGEKRNIKCSSIDFTQLAIQNVNQNEEANIEQQKQKLIQQEKEDSSKLKCHVCQKLIPTFNGLRRHLGRMHKEEMAKEQEKNANQQFQQIDHVNFSNLWFGSFGENQAMQNQIQSSQEKSKNSKATNQPEDLQPEHRSQIQRDKNDQNQNTNTNQRENQTSVGSEIQKGQQEDQGNDKAYETIIKQMNTDYSQTENNFHNSNNYKQFSHSDLLDAQDQEHNDEYLTFATPAVKIVMEGTPAGRYAWTLFMTAYQQDKPKEILTDIKYLQQLYDQSDDFRNLLSNPTIQREKVLSLFKEVTPGFQDLTRNLLQTLVVNKRTDQLHLICKRFVEYMKIQERKEIVTVVSAEELNQSDKERVSAALDEFGKGTSYTISYRVDPSIIGGLQLYFPNAFMDLSLFSRINKIKEDTQSLM